MSTRRLFPAALAALVALASAAGAARAQCTYTALASGSAQLATGTPTYYSFTQSAAYWTAVAVRPPLGEDWDMSVYSGTAAYPTCVSGTLASSTYGTNVTDFVIGDFNADPVGTYYVKAYRFSGTGSATVEWEDGTDLASVGGGAITQSTGTNDLVKVWDVYLSAGASYVFSLSHTGSGDLKMLLFHNPGGVYWTGRAGAVLQIAGTGCATYTAPSSGYYGVAVVNDNGATDTYTLGVSGAPCGCPGALASQTPVSDAPTDQVHSFTQSNIYWAAVAVYSTTDWDIQLASNASGSASPSCVSNVLASSSLGGGVVDFVVGDFNHSPLGPYDVHTHEFTGSATASTQWYGGAQSLQLNAPFVLHTRAAGDLIECYDVYLQAGQTYSIAFLDLQAHLKAFLFRNPTGGPYFTQRFNADIAMGSFYQGTYVAPSTGFYGIVVVDDTGQGGNYDLQIDVCTPPIALADKTPGFATHGEDYFSFTAGAPHWGAVGPSYAGETRWISAFTTPGGAGPSQCFSGQVANSNQAGNDFLVGDFRYDPLGTYYAWTHVADQTPATTASVKWDSGDGTVVVNDNNFTTAYEDGTDWLHVYDVQLMSNVAYRLDGSTNPSVIGPAAYFYENPGSAPYWASTPQYAAQVSGNPYFYVPNDGLHGLVVFDWNGLASTYSMRIVACPPTTPLASGVPDPVPAMGLYRIDQESPYWMAVGVRSSSDWDIEADHDSSGRDLGICFANPLTASTGVGWVDYVVGDFNAGGNPYGTYYIRPYRFSGSAPGLAEWDGGADQIVVGAPWTHRVTGPSQVLECWDVYLQQGQSYDLYLKADPGVDAKLDLFKSNNAPYWAPRSARVYEGTTTGTYVAPATDFYGLVLVNDNGGAGNVDLGVYITGTAAVNDGGPAPATTLTAISPNPGRGALRIQYALHQDAPVSFDVLDVSGRVVSHLDEGERTAGSWSVEWPGTGDGGRHLPAGLYFVRMSAANQPIATKRVTLLN